MDAAKILEEVGKLQTNLEVFRKTNDEQMVHIKDFGAKHGDLESKIAAIGPDLAAQAIQIAELKRSIMMANQGNGVVDLTPEVRAAKSALISYLRKGMELGRMTGDEIKALSTLSNPDGGYNVTADISGRILAKMQLMSPMRQYASKQTISTDALEGPIDNQEAEANWVGETEARADTATPQIGQWRVPVHELYAKPKATQKLLDDSAVDMGAWLIKKLGERFGRREADAFINGDGVGKPRGLLSQTMNYTADATRAWGTVQKIKTGAAGAFAAAPNGGDVFISAMTALHPRYWAGALFFMNRFTLGEAMKLKDSQGQYVWMPDFTAGGVGTIKGHKVDPGFDHMPDIAANSLSIGFGNIGEAYQIVDRMGVRILRDPFSSKPYVEFYSTYRVGGDVLNSEAVKLIEFKA